MFINWEGIFKKKNGWNYECRVKFSPRISSPTYCKVIFKVSYVFRCLVSPNILDLKTLIGLFRYVHE